MPSLHIHKADMLHCKKLNRMHGKSYFFATRFFPKELRIATYVLYAFFRVPDELVDNPVDTAPAAITTSIEAWRSAWRTCYMEGTSDDPVLRATYAVFKQYDIPYEYSEAFLQAMIQDVTVDRYQTYEALEYYMYGSAAVVGLMMTHVIGFNTQQALVHAKQLGYAMQLTNFIRDIREDVRDRGRIYMPLDELGTFGITEEALVSETHSDELVTFLKYQIERARTLYSEAETGIALLDSRGKFAVRAASRLYGAILGKVEDAEYRVFDGRVGTSLFEKIRIVWKLYIQKK